MFLTTFYWFKIQVLINKHTLSWEKFYWKPVNVDLLTKMLRPCTFWKRSTKNFLIFQNQLLSGKSSLKTLRKSDGLRKSKPNRQKLESLCSNEWWNKIKVNTQEKELRSLTLKKPTQLTTEREYTQKENFQRKENTQKKEAAPYFLKRTKTYFLHKKILILNIVR